VPALVTLEDANFGAIPFDLIGRAPSQMGVAAAFAAADRSNKSLILDDEGTPFHCPARNQYPQRAYNPGKRAELGRQERGCEKPVQNRFAEGKERDDVGSGFCLRVKHKSTRWPRRYGRPMQACRPFGKITLHGQGL
jgi:hypothetical protein